MMASKKQHSEQDSHTSVNSFESSGVAQKASIIVVSRAITIVTQLLALMILTRLLSKENFSLISFLLLTYSTVLTVCQLGLPDSIFYFFGKIERESQKALVLQTTKALFVISLFGAFIILIIQFSASLWGTELKGLLWPFMLLVVLELPTMPMPNILIAIGRTKDAGLLNIFIGLTQFCALILPLSAGYSIAFVVYSLLGYGMARFLFSGYLFLKYFKNKSTKLRKGSLRAQFRYAIPVSIAQILWGLNRQIDKYVVKFLFPTVVFAEYVVGAWEIPLIPTIAYSVASVMMPQFVSFYLKDQKADLLALWRKSIQKVSIIVLPLVVLFLIVAEEFIVILASEKYIGATLPFRIYTFIIFQRVAAYSSIMKAIDDTKTITRSAIYLLIINVVLNIPLAFLLGIAGPPLATLIANFFTWGYSLNKIKTKLNVTLSEVFPFPFYFRTLLTAAAAAVPVLFLKYQLIFSYPVKLVLLTTSYFVAYTILANLSGVVKKEDWRKLLTLLKLKSAE